MKVVNHPMADEPRATAPLCFTPVNLLDSRNG